MLRDNREEKHSLWVCRGMLREPSSKRGCVLSDTEAAQTCGRIPGRISKCETQERNVGRPDVFRTQGARRRQAHARPTYRQLKAGL